MALTHGSVGFNDKKYNKVWCVSHVCFLILFLLMLTGCSSNHNNTVSQDFSMNTIQIDSVSETDSGYYRIYNGNEEDDRFFFFYDLYDKEGSLIKRQCTYMHEPHITILDSNTIKVSVQAGTGRSTAWTYYYDPQAVVFSPTFYYVLCEKNNLVVYFDGKQIVVCDMFSKEKYYKEIPLNDDLSDTTDPIETVAFSDDLGEITVTYVSGVDYRQKMEIIRIQ